MPSSAYRKGLEWLCNLSKIPQWINVMDVGYGSMETVFGAITVIHFPCLSQGRHSEVIDLHERPEDLAGKEGGFTVCWDFSDILMYLHLSWMWWGLILNRESWIRIYILGKKTLVGQWELEVFIEVAEKLLQTDRLVWKIPAEHLLRVPRVLGPAEIARGLLIQSIPSFPLRFETIWLAFPYYVHEGSRYSID